jgi:hypothetical protein
MFRLRQQRSRLFQKKTSDVGKLDFLPCAQEQRSAKFKLQIPYLSTQSRLGNEKLA